MKKVFFKPWIGKEYKSGGIFGKKILVVGESHYCGGCDGCGIKFAEQCDDVQTSDIVKTYLRTHSGEWARTFRKFERALVGHETDNIESERIWNSIAFYNYIQVAMTATRIAPGDEEYDAAEEPFFEVLNRLRPDLMIVWGVTRMWDNMPSRNWEKSDEIEVEGRKVKNGQYMLDDDHCVRSIWINHPSSGFSWNLWNKVIQKVLY